VMTTRSPPVLPAIPIPLNDTLCHRFVRSYSFIALGEDRPPSANQRNSQHSAPAIDQSHRKTHRKSKYAAPDLVQPGILSRLADSRDKNP